MATDTNDTSLLKRAFLKIEELERRLKERDNSSREPIAVIGMGCRFPGQVQDPGSFWKLLMNGSDAIGPIPSKRLNIKDFQSSDQNSTAKIYVNCGGFLHEDIAMFDSQFFGISGREAKALDPQQRLILETTWEALEHAGQNPDELAGSKTGVFLGVAANDYKQVILQTRNLAEFNLYYLTGNAFSTASGRLSYFLGLNGPSLTIDTACSASLTAVHSACQSIWMRESEIALAGGVNLVLSPEDLLSYCSASMLSTEGRCKSFDSSADGFVLSEGCGVVVLKRLSDAVKNNDTVYAVIRGSAINQDGASNGLTAPSSPAQEMLIREALKKADLNAADINYIEAHGSGTPLGDPIEVQALASVFGKRDVSNPLIIGCVKTNIGHCAAAAGIAGLIKTILSIHYKKIPKNLHFSNPNPLIPWSEITAHVPTSAIDWNPENGIRRAGVSSFGVSGSNAHVILQDAPSSGPTGPSRKWQMLPLSAKTETALNSMVTNLCSWINRNPQTPLADIAYTLQTGRKNFPFRQFVICKDTTDAQTALGTTDETTGSRHTFSGRHPKVVFVFPGQGTQYPGMGAALYESEPVFRDAFDQCANAFSLSIGEDLRHVVFERVSNDTTTKLKNTLYAQPAIFSLEYSLARLWQSWGIQPAALVGHSIGEFVAACIAGVMSLEDATSLVAKRSNLMQSLPPGAMISVRSTEEAITPMLSSELSIAAINSPVLSVVSGPFGPIAEFQGRCESANIPVRPLHTSHAFHSAMVEPVLASFKEHVDTVKLGKPAIPIMSTVTGTWLRDDDARDPMYWTRHMRVTVRFSDAIKKLLEIFSNGLFLEVGPRSTSTILVQQHIHDMTSHFAVASMSDSGEPDSDLQQLLKTTGYLWAHGIALDYQLYYRTQKRIRLALPTYSFERQRYWVDNSSTAAPLYNDQVQQQESTLIPVSQINNEPSTPLTAGKDENLNKVRNLIAIALGCTPGAIDETATFLHLGMDSLLMRQFSQQIKSVFNADVTIRQLMREYTTIRTLTSFINKGNYIS